MSDTPASPPPASPPPSVQNTTTPAVNTPVPNTTTSSPSTTAPVPSTPAAPQTSSNPPAPKPPTPSTPSAPPATPPVQATPASSPPPPPVSPQPPTELSPVTPTPSKPAAPTPQQVLLTNNQNMFISKTTERLAQHKTMMSNKSISIVAMNQAISLLSNMAKDFVSPQGGFSAHFDVFLNYIKNHSNGRNGLMDNINALRGIDSLDANSKRRLETLYYLFFVAATKSSNRISIDSANAILKSPILVNYITAKIQNAVKK
jgi:hypothetical protein